VKGKILACVKIDSELLLQFELTINPAHPEKCAIPTKVLGYGEISTVIQIGKGQNKDIAYKRMPIFKNMAEAENYKNLYHEYLDVLSNKIGLNLVEENICLLPDEKKKRATGYIAQKKLPKYSIGHNVIHQLSATEVCKLVKAVLREAEKVYEFNAKHKGDLEIAIDGQISNWAIKHFDPQAASLGNQFELYYFDTSTPLLRKKGQEQLNPELFLRSAPSFLVLIIRLLFLQEVMTRYYNFRKMVIDLLANFYKEQRADLIPDLVEAVNDFFIEKIKSGSFKPITEKEVKSYYREDAWIWRIYLIFRKVDRFFHKILRKNYPYILPEKIKR
jgi:hypothetical protein